MTERAQDRRPLLSVRELGVWFETSRGPLRAVSGVSFDLQQGETLGVVGESGSGKSVLVRSIMKLLPRTAHFDAGSQLLYEGRLLDTMPSLQERHFWGTEIAMVFQDPMTSLHPVKRVGTQLTESMRFHLGCSASEAKARGLDLLARVGIPEPRRRFDQYPHELSGGMRQRVGIAVALACEPKLLVADEPTTALDVTVQRQILDLLGTLQEERGMAMILISHDLGVVAHVTDRVAVMYAGEMVEAAPTRELFLDIEHPYTEALIASIPRLTHQPHQRLQAIAGRPPDMVHVPEGCRFAPRCRYAQVRCVEEHPALLPSDRDDHAHRCHFPLGGSDVLVGAASREAEPATPGTSEEP